MQKNKMKLKSFSLFLIMFLLSVGVSAQQRSISGTVTDSEGEPIIGATVQGKGTSVATITNIDGHYSLALPVNVNTLEVRYIGFKTVDVSINGNVVNIVLEENITALDEMVVIGYGSVKKRDLTGSVSSMKSESLVQVPVANVAEAMVGRMAGVRVTTADGSPNADIQIRVRGGGSITQDNSPLYIVDGFPVSSFSDIPAGDIESIDVLKDASSTAIYGAQGANGVVLITTKRAKAGKIQVSYNGFVQSKRLSKRLEVLDPYEYVKLQYELASFNNDITGYTNKFGVYDDMDLYKYQRGVDWQQDMFGSDVISQQHNVSIAGGNDKTRYLISATYNFDGGLMPYTDFSRLNLNFKIDQEISKSLRFSMSARTTDTETNGDGSAGGTNKIRTFEAVTRGPVKGLQDFVEVDPGMMTEEEYDQWIQENRSLSDRAHDYWRRRNNRSFFYDAALEWKVLTGLSYRLEGGYGYGFNENKRYYGRTTQNAINDGGGKPYVSWQKENTSRWRLANILTYDFSLNDDAHRFNMMLGQELNSSKGYSNTMTAKGFSNDLSPEKIYANIGLGDGGSDVSSSEGEPNNMASFFGRAGYNFKDRYLTSFTLRADGSSKFGPGNKWGYFPSFAAAWRISEEPFMADTKKYISDMKLRASYGEAGNNRISSGLYKLDYRISSTGTYAIGDKPNNYYQPRNNQLPNPDIRWESLVTKNIGLDFGLFNQRIFGTVEYYWNTSSDLLLDLKITAPGYSSMMKNIGQTTNKGIEITLNGNIANRKNFTFNSNFNIGFNKSNVDALDSEGNFFPFRTGWASTDLRGVDEYEVRVGQPIGLIYGWITDGYYKTSDFSAYEGGKYIIALDANGNPVAPTTALTSGRIGMRPGTIKFKDISGPDGVPDGVVDDYDRTVIGNANPKFAGGFGFDGTFLQNFDYALNFSFVYGNNIYNANKLASSQQYRTSNPNLLGIFTSDNRYTYIGDTGEIVTDLALLAEMNEGANAKEYWSPLSFGNTNAVIHSWAIEDGSFLRLQNVTLGYTLPREITRKFACERLRLYTTMNNLWVWTNYSGYDPEVSSPGRSNVPTQLIPGLDYSAYPKSFSFTFGLNLTF